MSHHVQLMALVHIQQRAHHIWLHLQLFWPLPFCPTHLLQYSCLSSIFQLAVTLRDLVVCNTGSAPLCFLILLGFPSAMFQAKISTESHLRAQSQGLQQHRCTHSAPAECCKSVVRQFACSRRHTAPADRLMPFSSGFSAGRTLKQSSQT